MNAGPSPSRNWRAQPPVGTVYAREWRSGRGGPSSRFSRKFRLRLVAFGLVGLVAVIIVLLAPWGSRVPPMHIVTFGIGAYGGRANPRGDMPANPFGEQDARAFGELHERNPIQFPSVKSEDNALNGAQFLSFLQSEAQSSGLGRQHLLVFCTLHGVVQPSGEVELFAIDATPDSPDVSSGTMIPFKELVARLRESRARRVLLVLDAARLDSAWKLGILANDVAAQLMRDFPPASQSKDSRSKDGDNLSLLLAAGPGQQSWPATDRTAFVRFLIEGLSGDADGWAEQGGRAARLDNHIDRRVSLHELTAFVRQHVAESTRERCGIAQTPVLLGNATDFDMAVVSPPASAVPKPATKGTEPKAAETDKQVQQEAAESKSEKKEKTDASKTTDGEASETDSNATPSDAPKGDSPKRDPAAPPEPKWDVRLAELWQARDEWRDEVGSGRHPTARQMPLAWRAFETHLAQAEILRRAGLEELAPQSVRQADAQFKKLKTREAAAVGWELPRDDPRRQTLQDLGVASVDSPAPSAEALAAAGQYIQSLLTEPSAEKKPPTNGLPSKSAESSRTPDGMVLQAWLFQELLRDDSAKNCAQLQPVAARLQELGQLPQTADSVLLRDVLTAVATDSQPRGGRPLQRILDARRRFRRLAVGMPESLPMVRATVQSGLRALESAERWLLMTSASQPEVLFWLDRAEETADDAALAARQYGELIGLWSDLLSELPSAAEWVAFRAADDDRRSLDWPRLREVARQWMNYGKDGRWEIEPLRAAWPDKPIRSTDLERLLLALFVDAERLKVGLLTSADASSQRPLFDDLSKLVADIAAHRREFWEEVQRSLPRLGTADRPTPLAWRETDRLLTQPWLPGDERRRLDRLWQLDPRGDGLGNKSAEVSSLWHGFWAIATVSLLSQDKEATSSLWQDWEKLGDLSQEAMRQQGSAEQDVLRRKRAELGKALRIEWNKTQARARSSKSVANLAACHLRAAILPTTILPQNDPDAQIREELQHQFAEWLLVFSTAWRNRPADTASSESQGYTALAHRAETLARDLAGVTLREASSPRSRLRDVGRLTFDPDRRGRLNVSVESEKPSGSELKMLLTAAPVSLLEGSRTTTINKTLERPLTDGQLSLDLKLAELKESTHSWVVALAEKDGFPIEFRRIPLYPPFNPHEWRIEFVEPATNVPLEGYKLAERAGLKLFLPPSASLSCRAELVRPKKDATASAKITLYRITESGRVPLIENFELELKTGQERTPLLLDLPAKPKEEKDSKDQKEGKETATLAAAPLADLARGWLFEITPDGQQPLQFAIQPTFFSASKFIARPAPQIKDDRFMLGLERLPASAAAHDEALLPAQIPVELQLPDSLREQVSDYTLGGPVDFGQRLTLSFTLPPNWSDQARERDWNLALDVAGLPHAYRWRIKSSGDVEEIEGQPPQLGIRLLLPKADEKAPPRLEPVLRKGKEPLRLQFQVDATELDRSEGTGDWILAYVIVRETEDGSEPTPLRYSWRLFSSRERHIELAGIQAGVWKLTTSANDFEKEEKETEIRGLSGRFQVQAALSRTDKPQQPVGTAKFRFAIDDDAPPALEVKGLTTDPRPADKDLSFTIEATDPESGIQRAVFGFDKNDDKKLQEDEERIDARSSVALDNPQVRWSVALSRLKLPKLEKNEETHRLIVEASNGLGTTSTRVVPITFRKPTPPKGTTTGSLIINLKLSRGAKSTIQLTGPEARLEETSGSSHTFSNLPAGQYQIKVNVNYAVIGRKEAGEATVDVKAGQATPANVALSAVKETRDK